MTAAQAAAAVSVLELDGAAALALRLQPMRGSLDSPIPADPTMYRFYEIIQAYGPTIKELIHEEPGNGGRHLRRQRPCAAPPVVQCACRPPCRDRTSSHGTELIQHRLR